MMRRLVVCAALMWGGVAFAQSPVQVTGPIVKGDIAVFNSPTIVQGSSSSTNPTTFKGDVFFGSGRPWVDVRSGANGCAAAKGDGATDDTSAFQCQINFMNSTFTGGVVYVPPSNNPYLVSGGGFTIKGGVQVVGAGATSSIIEALTDSAVVTFDAATCNRYAALENLYIIGYQNVAATQSTVTIGSNCSVVIRDTYIWFGLNGLNNAGVDSAVVNSYICGYGDAIRSTGANWYIRVKADTCAITSVNGFEQLGSTTLENHIIQSDFSGSYTNSIRINNSSAVTSISQSVMANNISIAAANFTQIDGSEFGSGISFSGNGNITLTNDVILTGTLTPSGGLYNCAGNVNVICPMFSQSSLVIGGTGTNCALVAGDQVWHNGTNQNLALTVKQNLGTGIALQSLNDACNAFEALEIEATNLQITQGPLTLGLSGSVVGQAIFQNATTGGITVQAPTGGLGTVTNTLQAATDTFVYKATADILTNKTIAFASNTLTGVAPLASPTFSGTVTMPDSATWTSSGISATAINNSSLGATTPSTAKVTSLNASGQITSTAGLPTIGSGACGTGSNGAVVSGSTNQSGQITIGAAATTTCTISWSTTLATAPNACVFFPMNATAAATGTTVARVGAPSTGSVVLTGSALANANYAYLCL